MNPVDPGQFVQIVKPLLESRDVQGLVETLRTRWNHEQIKSLIRCGDMDARKVAILALGLVGQRCCIDLLVEQLKDPDPVINQLAEHSLWSVWFREGDEQANHELGRGTQALNRREFEHAIEHFDRAIAAAPAFAEAYNQRGLAWYLQEQYQKSISDCLAAIQRMPCHFGAWAGLGHCYVHLCVWREAVRTYRKALEINPHLESVRQVIEELNRLQSEADLQK